MKYIVFAIKDKALDSFSAPFTQATIEAGLRMWRDLVLFGSEDNRYRRTPEDFTLYMVGEFDDDTAEFTDAVNVRLASAAEVKAEAKQTPEG